MNTLTFFAATINCHWILKLNSMRVCVHTFTACLTQFGIDKYVTINEQAFTFDQQK